MHGRPKLEEQYKKGSDVINFVIYDSVSGLGENQVIQHRVLGTTKAAHITLRPDGSVNFRIKRNKTALELAVRNDLSGYVPTSSARVKKFLTKIRNKI